MDVSKEAFSYDLQYMRLIDVSVRVLTVPTWEYTNCSTDHGSSPEQAIYVHTKHFCRPSPQRIHHWCKIHLHCHQNKRKLFSQWSLRIDILTRVLITASTGQQPLHIHVEDTSIILNNFAQPDVIIKYMCSGRVGVSCPTCGTSRDVSWHMLDKGSPFTTKRKTTAHAYELSWKYSGRVSVSCPTCGTRRDIFWHMQEITTHE